MKFTETEHNYIETDEEREEGHIDVRTSKSSVRRSAWL